MIIGPDGNPVSSPHSASDNITEAALSGNSAYSFEDMGKDISKWWNGSRINPKNWFNHIFSGNNVISDALGTSASEGKIAYTSSGIPYDSSNIDSQINALMQEYANKRDDESYDRLIAALKRNGINPALALSNSASPMSSDSGFRSNYNLTTKDQVNSALKLGTILVLLAKFLK